MSDPYTPPSSDPNLAGMPFFELDAAMNKRKTWKRIMWVSIAGIIIPILIAITGVIVGMSRAFETLADGDGSADPGELAKDISISLLSGLYGSVISFIFLILLIVTVIKLRSIGKRIRSNLSLRAKADTS